MAAVLFLAALLARGLAVLRHRVNSDEPQHLHVAWAWTQGLLPYRDVFDNHSPLFSLMMSWPLRALGESPDVVLYMRLWMIPFALGTTLFAALIARRLFGARVALWSVVLLSAQADFLLGTVEYRTDVAWACAWLATLAVLVCGRLSTRRAFAAGLLAGVALAISMKTTLLLAAMTAGAVIAWFATRDDVRPSAARVASLAAAAAGGFVIVPLAVVVAFARLGALPAMIQCVVGYNVVPGLGLWGRAPLRPLGWFLGAPVLTALILWVSGRGTTPGVAGRRALALASAGFAHLAIETLWPLVVRGDMLPLWPVEAIFLAAMLGAILPAAVRTRPALSLALSRAALVLAALGELAMTSRVADLGHDRTYPERRALAEVLNLTRPGDLVMSVKGEAVFRRRPVYTAIETIAEERYRQRRLADDIPERLTATGTPVVMQYDMQPYPPRARAFMLANYVPLGDVRVLGQYLDPARRMPDERPFVIAVPQEFTLFGRDGPARGTLDGEPWRGPRRLEAGRHRYTAAPGEGRLALVWAPAVERGYAPALLPEPPLALGAHDRLLVLAPHPDDEIVSNGGLIQAALVAGAAVRVVWATDGERNPWAQLAHERRWPTSAADRERWGALRRGESRRALRALGGSDVGQTWLGLPDAGLTEEWMSGDERLVDSLRDLMREFRPTIVSVPSIFDGHPDHSTMGLAADVALARLGDATERPRLVTYVAHPPELAPDPSLYVRVPPVARDRKVRAIECLASQLHWRRRELIAFADSAEWFGVADRIVAGSQTHRVRGAWLEDGRIEVEFGPGEWPHLGPLELRVSCDGASGPLARLDVMLPDHAGDLDVLDGSGRATGVRARLTRAGTLWRVSVPLQLAEPPRSVFVKIERPRELAYGFFDESGWWPVVPLAEAGRGAPPGVRRWDAPTSP